MYNYLTNVKLGVLKSFPSFFIFQFCLSFHNLILQYLLNFKFILRNHFDFIFIKLLQYQINTKTFGLYSILRASIFLSYN